MKGNRKKNIFLRIIYNPKFLALVGLIIIILISFPLAKNVSKRYKINQEIKDLELEIAEYELKNKDLKQLIKYLESLKLQYFLILAKFIVILF